jgi:hypothetical protein
MQIVIDIDENLYTRLFDNGDEYVADMRRACVAIRKGTPLPKGHGRLIDESDFMPDSDYEDGVFYAVSVGQITGLPTVVEADKEDKK